MAHLPEGLVVGVLAEEEGAEEDGDVGDASHLGEFYCHCLLLVSLFLENLVSRHVDRFLGDSRFCSIRFDSE